LFVFFFSGRVSFTALASLKLVILLPQLPECWDYRRAPPCPDLLSDFYLHTAPCPLCLPSLAYVTCFSYVSPLLRRT
jgi:hypothetical protein